jgi:hypothetical protein
LDISQQSEGEYQDSSEKEAESDSFEGEQDETDHDGVAQPKMVPMTMTYL